MKKIHCCIPLSLAAAMLCPVLARAQSLQVTGPATVGASTSVQFNANVQGLPSGQPIYWSVNGVVGGNAQFGFISTSGLYQAPLAVPSSPNIQILADSPWNNWQLHSAVNVTIANPPPQVTSAVPGLLIGDEYTVDVYGSNYVENSEISINGQGTPSELVGTGHLRTITYNAAGSTLSIGVINPAPGGGGSNQISMTIPAQSITATAASRFLEQATFGPTLNNINSLMQTGFSSWLTQQFNTAPTLMTPQEASLPANQNSTEEGNDRIWWQTALTGPDQLRQRVAFALSNIFVVSYLELDSHNMPYYYDTLSNDAFTNYLQIMKDVALTPAMGQYLNMVNSEKTVNGQIPNENFPRELMQLFTLGPNLLNSDGTTQIGSNGQPIPTYTQTQVEALARAFTGWTFANAAGNFWGYPNFTQPMIPVDAFHDTTAKTLLGGTTLPAGQSAQEDFDQAMQNIFNQPNLPPFVSRQLIQHLVTSNPSSEYVQRVAAVFQNDGQGVRGDMKAVIQAILLDPEARAGDTWNWPQNFGRLREPILWQTAALRGLGITPTQPGAEAFENMSAAAGSMGQMPLDATSVFNYFAPTGQAPGTGIEGPEFALETSNLIPDKLDFADSLVQGWVGPIYIDLTQTSMWGQAAMASNGALVDQLNITLMNNQMSSQMRQIILNAISGVSDAGQRVRIAAYLVITSPQFRVQH